MDAQELIEEIDTGSRRSSLTSILSSRRSSGGSSKRQSKSSVFGRYGRSRPTAEEEAKERINRAFASLERVCVTEEARGSMKVSLLIGWDYSNSVWVWLLVFKVRVTDAGDELLETWYDRKCR